MTECGEIPQICHVFRLSIKTARVQRICTAPPPPFAVPKIFLLSTRNLWLEANAFQQKAFAKSFHNHSRGEKQPDTASMKSRQCGQRRQVQMQIQRMTTLL